MSEKSIVMNKIDILEARIKADETELNKIKSQYSKVRSAEIDVRNFKNQFMKKSQRNLNIQLQEGGSLYSNSTKIKILIPNEYLLERLRQCFMDEKRTLCMMGIEYERLFNGETP